MSRAHAGPRQRTAAPVTRSDIAADHHCSLTTTLYLLGATLVAGLWSYWPTLTALFKDWQRDGDYSVGQLVPLAALYLAWQHRDSLRRCRIAPCWLGLALLLLAQAVRLFGILYVYESAERYSFVLAIAGLVLLVAGRRVFWQLRWVLLFLALMVPLPGRAHNLIAGPLQNCATRGTVFLLELFGVAVSRHGNIMVLNDSTHLAVAEACSGLRMLTAFVVVAAVLAYIVKRPRWQKFLLVASSIPIAIACNLMRLLVTAILYLLTTSELAERFFHDFAGVTMMPMAILLLLGELWIMARLVVTDPPPSKP